MRKQLIITIDGPAGAGKSTMAKLLASKLRFHYLDTGALYRAITLKTIQNRIRFSDKQAISELVAKTKLEINFPSYKRQGYKGKEKILMDNKDISKEIRTPQLSTTVSKISSSRIVRTEMVNLQRKIARGKDIVCEGRDMGSVVFPDAQIKIYLDASIEERAKRRYKESRLLFPEKRLSFKRILNDILMRDYKDTHRKTAPLVKPHNSFYIDTTDLSQRQVLNRLVKIVNGEIEKNNKFLAV